jgi:ActR/RegA family two-component response regulator
MQRRLLCVDDEEIIRTTMSAILTGHGFAVTTAASVPEALQKITTEPFDVLLSDLNVGNPGDGLTVVSAMRRTQPHALTIILTGYPAFETALEAIRQQVDDYIVKPANIPALLTVIESKLKLPPGRRQFPTLKRVAQVLEEQRERIQELWLARIAEDTSRPAAPLTRTQRMEHLRTVLDAVVCAAQSSSEKDLAGSHHRRPATAPLGHTAQTLLAEFCWLRRVIAQVVQENLLAVNLSYVVPDLARVNESLDEQIQAALDALTNQSAARKAEKHR